MQFISYIGWSNAIDIFVVITFIGLAILFNKGKTNRGSCWAITLTVIGWACFAKGILEALQITHVIGWRFEHWSESESHVTLLIATIYKTLAAGLSFLFAAYILRSLEDALRHFKTRSVLAISYYSSLVEKDSPSVSPHDGRHDYGDDDDDYWSHSDPQI